jgi:hypothetical protein
MNSHLSIRKALHRLYAGCSCYGGLEKRAARQGRGEGRAYRSLAGPQPRCAWRMEWRRMYLQRPPATATPVSVHV